MKTFNQIKEQFTTLFEEIESNGPNIHWCSQRETYEIKDDLAQVYSDLEELAEKDYISEFCDANHIIESETRFLLNILTFVEDAIVDYELVEDFDELAIKKYSRLINKRFNEINKQLSLIEKAIKNKEFAREAAADGLNELDALNYPPAVD
jgi:hypothetical protein